MVYDPLTLAHGTQTLTSDYICCHSDDCRAYYLTLQSAEYAFRIA